MSSLRFAALVRVSTDRQSQQGQSLITQRKEAMENIPALNGRIAAWYGGSEHATPGHEHAEVNRLLADAAKGKFDAIHVSHPDRWSRDNGKSKQGLEILRRHKVRFFVCKQEYNLHDPTACLFLGMSAEIGEFQASNQSQKSMKNRIDRAREGKPVSGNLPFGRTFDKKTSQWSVDPIKHAMIQDCARRYLKGESMQSLADEYDLNLSTVHKVLTQRSGPVWIQRFKSERLNIDEEVSTTVPELLPSQTIALILAKAQANKTYTHGHSVHQYLLSRVIFCASCGRAMHGQEKQGYRYYRHSNIRDEGCKGKLPRPVAERLEEAVLFHLFDLFGNASRVAQAIRDASPDPEQQLIDRQRHERLTADRAKIETQRQRIVDAIADGTIAKVLVKSKLEDLHGREQTIGEELDRLSATLANVPSAKEIKLFAEKVTKRRSCAPSRHKIMVDFANRDIDGMTFEERRELMQLVFGGKTPDGKRLGVYVTLEGKKPKYRILGKLVDETGTVPERPFGPVDPHDECFYGAPKQEALLQEATSSARP
jgi:DNA invertase Pin-like site-specific DNA recombinase